MYLCVALYASQINAKTRRKAYHEKLHPHYTVFFRRSHAGLDQNSKKDLRSILFSVCLHWLLSVKVTTRKEGSHLATIWILISGMRKEGALCLVFFSIKGNHYEVCLLIILSFFFLQMIQRKKWNLQPKIFIKNVFLWINNHKKD